MIARKLLTSYRIVIRLRSIHKYYLFAWSSVREYWRLFKKKVR